jgi:saccharopine dehydrogenase-like NADP-dependent oxidoreductase
LVAGAHVCYLLDQPDFHVTVASRTLSKKAQDIIRGHPKGDARQLDVADEAALEGLVRQADLAVSLMLLEKMHYEEGERDMLILQHEFLAEYPDPSTGRRDKLVELSGQRRKEKITSTMIDFGIPHGDTSMSRTVGLPAAIGVRLILQGKINLTGVHTPVVPEIYEPVLEELEQLGIHFTEKWETLEK